MSKATPNNGEFCWNELMTGNTKEARQFYSNLLGWESRDIDMGDAVYTIFKSGDKDICGMLEIPADQSADIPPHWMSYIWVDSVKTATSKAAELGANILVDQKEVPGMGKFTVLQDPTGAHVSLWEKA